MQRNDSFFDVGPVRPIRRRSRRDNLVKLLSNSLVMGGVWLPLLWLVCGIVALFFGWAGGEWGWGFGFGWYLSLLAAVVVAMAGLGIYASIRIFLRL